MRKQLDKNLSFHKLVAYMIALMTGELILPSPLVLKDGKSVNVMEFAYFINIYVWIRVNEYESYQHRCGFGFVGH